MNKANLLCLLLGLLLISSNVQAQNQEIVGGNLLNGAITGSLLGGATMGLTNSDDFTPLRVGLGAGILGGAGLVAYDMATRPSGGELYISGFFNNGRNSSVIILLDTVYGAAGGALIGLASMLIADKPVAEGLQYGASAGAWTGFTFGLIDAFVLANRQPDLAGSLLYRDSIVEVDRGAYQLGLGQPALLSRPSITSADISNQIELAMNVFSFRMSL
jgi:hypothetical protein